MIVKCGPRIRPSNVGHFVQEWRLNIRWANFFKSWSATRSPPLVRAPYRSTWRRSWKIVIRSIRRQWGRLHGGKLKMFAECLQPRCWKFAASASATAAAVASAADQFFGGATGMAGEGESCMVMVAVCVFMCAILGCPDESRAGAGSEPEAAATEANSKVPRRDEYRSQTHCQSNEYNKSQSLALH